MSKATHIMTSPLRPFVEPSRRAAILRIRSEAATIRSLLDELERAVPVPGASAPENAYLALRQQLAEELLRLGCQLLDCAAGLDP